MQCRNFGRLRNLLLFRITELIQENQELSGKINQELNEGD